MSEFSHNPRSGTAGSLSWSLLPFPLPVYSPSCLFPELPVFISFLYQFIEIININSKLKINTEFNSKKPEGEFRNWETIS
ncbi:hypothetical protein, partial [Methanosarcina mazei]|uniref:hypothetical protein n=1 Tax=Methanosarcina mazei TaxID=2209 RepID=UPI00064E66B1